MGVTKSTVVKILSHGKYRIGDTFGNHSKVYKSVQEDKSFYPRTCYNIRSINKTDRITYGEQCPDDIDKDILLVDTLFLDKQIGSVIW